MQFPIAIGLHHSRILIRLFVSFVLFALAGLMAVPWAVTIRASLSLLLLGGSVHFAHRLRTTVLVLRLHKDGRLEARPAGAAEFFSADVLAGCYVHPLLTVFRIRVSGQTSVLLLLPDSLDATDFRRLRAWLRQRVEVSDWRDGAEG